ncbi:MAG: glutamate 5-kinase [Alphaproteobacteria bacterium]
MTVTSWTSARRVVIKVGSALLVEAATGRLRSDWLAALAKDVHQLQQQDRQIIIVTSGAIALGRNRLGKPQGRLTLAEKQAAAAIGQITLAQGWAGALHAHDLGIAQHLVTLADTEDRRRHLNARAAISEVLKAGLIPLINENDTVSTAEIRFGDNDRLGARVAQMIGADLLVLMSDVDGLYSADPRKDSTATHLPEIPKLTAEIEAMAGAAPVGWSSGGMVTKLAAARIATGAGCHMLITDGRQSGALGDLFSGKSRHSWFHATTSPHSARKQWIGAAIDPAGTLTVDTGAARALTAGKSLLAAGISAASGNFHRGDPVLLTGPEGQELGRGLARYGQRDLQQILGRSSDEITSILGWSDGPVVVHRDDMALL